MKKTLKTKINPEIEKLKTEIVQLKSGWQRTQADFENFRKRMESDKINLLKYANEDLIVQILPILDNFSRALKHKPLSLCHPERAPIGRVEGSKEIFRQAQNDSKEEFQQIKNYLEGLGHIKTQLEQILTDNGLEKIETKIGDQFNPQIHEAIEIVDDKKIKKDHIVEIVLDGYKLGDKIIRPVKVRVAK